MNNQVTESCILLTLALAAVVFAGDGTGAEASKKPPSPAERVKAYAKVRLTTDLSILSESERQMIPLLIEAAEQMDAVFWKQAYGDKEALLGSIPDSDLRRLAEINYGPWDRLKGNEPFVPGVGPKPAGATFYPPDLTQDEFERHLAANPAEASAFKSQYTVVRRGPAGKLVASPYHQEYKPQVERAAAKLREAAKLAEDPGLRRYLELRADALLTDLYQPSDLAWLDMKNNTVDVVIGPIETYEDALFGYKACHEAYVLVKDKAWSKRLEKYAAFLPELQKGLPVPDAYKAESPGTDSDLNAYDCIYYAGDCNAGSKTIAINLPNDEEVQLKKGTRRLQLKNAMRAKFDNILAPIASVLIAADQRRHVTFDAFFGDTMFHEVAHGLGIKNTLHGKGTVREALKDHSSWVEEGKADILGLYMITKLKEQGALGEGELMDYYTTFLAGIFRSVRFGASSAHGKANMVRFNFFAKSGAFSRDDATGTYRVELEAMKSAMTALSAKLLELQGDGNYEEAQELMRELGMVPSTLERDLDRLAGQSIPVDVVFEQGLAFLR